MDERMGLGLQQHHVIIPLRRVKTRPFPSDLRLSQPEKPHKVAQCVSWIVYTRFDSAGLTCPLSSFPPPVGLGEQPEYF